MEISLGLGCNNQQLSICGFVGQIGVPQNGYDRHGVLCTGVFYGVPHGQTLAHGWSSCGWPRWSLDYLKWTVGCIYPLIFRKTFRELENHHMNYANQLLSWTMFNSHTVKSPFSVAVYIGAPSIHQLSDWMTRSKNAGHKWLLFRGHKSRTMDGYGWRNHMNP